MPAVHPLMFVGFAIVCVGFFLFAGMLFSRGGVRKSQQFRVMGEILSGKHGSRVRLAFAGGFLLMVAGACVCFAGVGMLDAARADRCVAHCQAGGYERGRIGPNGDRDPADRRTWWVACICEGGRNAPSEVRADSL